MSAPRYPDREPTLFLELARDRLATQLSFIDAVDAKLANAFSIASALLGVLAAVYALQPDPFRADGIALLAISGGAYLVIAERSVRGLWKRRWAVGPKLENVWADLFQRTERDVAWRVAAGIRADLIKNEGFASAKTRALRVVLVSLCVQTAALAAALSLVAYRA